MNYYSTNRQAPLASLEEAVVKGLAGDKGLYMPERIPSLDAGTISHLKEKSFHEIACLVAQAFFGEDMEPAVLDRIVRDTLSFETPVVQVHDNIYSLELFHGPTLAFKDVGARFMARLLGYFIQKEGIKEVNVLVATSGDTGSAVANGFLGVPGIHVYVLYPKGKVSPIQECQFTTLGQNITALEIDGTFDDCQALVKSAFMDNELNQRMKLTKADKLVISVPSGNFGNITAGLFAYWMGLPVKHFIAANNRNDVFLEYLHTGIYQPRPSVQTIANAMDVGAPSNFARIIDLFSRRGNPYSEIGKQISGARFTDEEIAEIIKRTYTKTGYLLDPHGACGYQALVDYPLASDETGLFLETAHPAKFKDTIDTILGKEIEIPPTLKSFMKGEKQRVALSHDFNGFKQYLMAQ